MSFPHGPSSNSAAKIDQLNIIPCEQSSYDFSSYLLNGDSAHTTTILLKTNNDTSDKMLDLNHSTLVSEPDSNGTNGISDYDHHPRQNVITNGNHDSPTKILASHHLNHASNHISYSPLNHEESKQPLNSSSKLKGKFWILSNNNNNNCSINNNDFNSSNSESEHKNFEPIQSSVNNGGDYGTLCDLSISNEVDVSSVLDSQVSDTKPQQTATKRRGRPKKSSTANTAPQSDIINNEEDDISTYDRRRRSTRLKNLEDKKENTSISPSDSLQDMILQTDLKADECLSEKGASLSLTIPNQVNACETNGIMSHDTTTNSCDKMVSKSKSAKSRSSKNDKASKKTKAKSKREKSKSHKRNKEAKRKVQLSSVDSQEKFASPFSALTPNTRIDIVSDFPSLKFDSEESSLLSHPEKVKSRWRRNSELENILSESTSNPPVLETVEKEPNFIDGCSEDIPHFTSIEENIYLFERKKSKSKKQTKKMVCDCILTKEERSRGVMGCGDDCLNRMLMMECGSRCPLGDHCSNKRFNKKQYAKVEPCKTFKKGWGLRALETIPPYTFIMEYVGEVIDPFDFHKRVEKYAKQKLEHHYFMALRSDEIIDATGKGNITRFINHSCEPNSETQKWTVNGELRIGFFTTKQVESGDEITFDYQFQRYGKKAQKCYCGSGSCRGYIGGENANILTDGSKIPKKGVSKEDEDVDSEEEEFLEDMGLEEEINFLHEEGLRNRKNILHLSRLMLRAEDSDLRIQLIDILMSTAQTFFLKLFIDYHGLQIIWSWMVEADLSEELKLKLLNLLEFLPISDKTILTNSKVLSVVEKWHRDDSPKSDPIVDAKIPEEPNNQEKSLIHENDVSIDDTIKLESHITTETENNIITEDNTKKTEDANKLLSCDESENIASAENNASSQDSPTKNYGKYTIKNKSKTPVTLSPPKPLDLSISSVAGRLLAHWKDLKHVFKIPRQEREKRQQDEEEADRLAQEDEERRASGLPAIHNKRMDYDYGTGTKRRCLKSLTDSNKDLAFKRNTSPEFFINPNNASNNKLSKEEYRKMFEYNLAQNDYAEALKKYHEDLAIYNATYREQMLQQQQKLQQLALQQADPSLILSNQYLSDSTNSLPALGSLFTSDFSIHLQTLAEQSANIGLGDLSNEFSQLVGFLESSDQLPELKEIVPKYESPLIVLSNESLNFSAPDYNLSPEAIDNVDFSQVHYDSDDLLESMEKKMFDEIYPPAGIFYITESEKTYFMALPSDLSQPINLKENVTEPLDLSFTERTPDSVMPPGWNCSSMGRHTYYYNKCKSIKQWHPPQDSQIDNFDDNPPMEIDLSGDFNQFNQSNTSSPIGVANKPFPIERKEIFHEELSDVKRRNAKRIHDVFRTKVSHFVVKCLNHFNKNGRFTKPEDFKYLARKLSHNVVAKEKKHCKHIEDLACTESVKLKTKEYIKKYMSKIGDVYKPDALD